MFCSAVLLPLVMFLMAYRMYAVFGLLVPDPVSANNITPTFTLVFRVPIRALIVAISELNFVPESNDALQFAELSRMINTLGARPVTAGLPANISVSSLNATDGQTNVAVRMAAHR